ncbi:MAG: hypothetical protein U1C55_10690, partial [Smithellaceae bacterium]|nr:hypothetical protein [Smithellaceae bacterium]
KLLALISGNPLIALVIGFFLLFILYLVFKQFMKLALIVFLIILAVGGYYYLKDPKGMPGNMIESARDVKDKTFETKDKLTDMYRQGKELIGKGADLIKDQGWTVKSDENPGDQQKKK